MKKILILLVSLPLLSISCETDDNTFSPSLPLITTTGENTFGCYVDGILVTPRNGASSIFGPAIGLVFSGCCPSSETSYNEINVQDHKSSARGIVDIHINNFKNIKTGDYIINESNCLRGSQANENINIRCFIRDRDTQFYKSYCSIENGGLLKITKNDTITDIVSGTFSFQAVNQDNPSDIIEVTEGRFDINRNTLNHYTDFP